MKSLAEIEAEVVAALKAGAGDVLKDQLEHHTDSFFATLRKVRPILHIPNGPVFVTLFQDVQEVLSRPEVFNVTYAPKMDPSVGPFMLARDGGTINERDKGIMRAMLRREDLPRVRETVAGLAAAAVRGGIFRLSGSRRRLDAALVTRHAVRHVPQLHVGRGDPWR
jgi:hypothetical protein